MSEGSHPIQGLAIGLFANVTIAACARGTAAATLLGTFTAYACRDIEVWNLTTVNLELVFGNDQGTNSYTSVTPSAGTVTTLIGNGTIFCPGSATVSFATVRGERNPMALSQGMTIWARTVTNVAVTCAAATPLYINFWE